MCWRGVAASPTASMAPVAPAVPSTQNTLFVHGENAWIARFRGMAAHPTAHMAPVAPAVLATCNAIQPWEVSRCGGASYSSHGACGTCGARDMQRHPALVSATVWRRIVQLTWLLWYLRRSRHATPSSLGKCHCVRADVTAPMAPAAPAVGSVAVWRRSLQHPWRLWDLQRSRPATQTARTVCSGPGNFLPKDVRVATWHMPDCGPGP